MQDNEGLLMSPKVVLTPVAIANFPHLLEPAKLSEKEKKDGKKPMYRMSVIFPPDTDLKELKQAAINAAIERWDSATIKKWMADPKSKFDMPFRSGNDRIYEKRDEPNFSEDEEDAYKNATYINIKSTEKIQVGMKVQGKWLPIDNRDDLYSGMYCRAVISASAYEHTGNRGVSFWMTVVIKTKDGTRFDTKINPEKDLPMLPNFDGPIPSPTGHPMGYDDNNTEPVPDGDYDSYFKQDSGTPDFLT